MERPPESPVVVCGLGRVGLHVVEFLRTAGVPVVVVDTHATETDLGPGVELVVGDCRKAESLQRARIDQARGVLIVTSDDLVNISAALLARRLNPECRIVVRMFNQNLLSRLGGAVRNMTALSVSALTAPLLALSALTGDALAAFPLDGGAQQILEIPVAPGSGLVGRTLADAARQHHWLVLSCAEPSGRAWRLREVPGDRRLAAGDTITVCGAAADLEPFRPDGDDPRDQVRWAGRLPRLWRTARRTLGDVDLPVKLGTAALFLTLLAGTLVYRFALAEPWGDSLYQTVSVVATGADLHGEGRPEWAKVFLSVLKITGAAIIAGFTAILTQYLLRVKLGGAFETRKIPEAGHVVVCGLGNVGFRCIEELVRVGRPVVAIERDANNSYVATVRRMGVPVIAGDATVPAVLRQARCDAARAVIAAADSELANLEIALLVRELNPKQRVVVRLNDPQFAQAVREAADIRLALAVPALAAPAFAAALSGDRVLALFNLGEQSYAVIEVNVGPADAALGEALLAAAMVDYRFLPVGLAGRAPFAADGIPTGHRLRPGDRLTAIVAMADLELLLRRQPAERVWSVTIDSHPALTPGALLTLVRTVRACSQAEAEELLSRQAFTLAEGLTRGEAEELLARVTRERSKAHLDRVSGTAKP